MPITLGRGSTDINKRDKSLLNYILLSSLSIENRGEEPTFVGPTSRNVLDLTLATSGNTLTENWQVLETPSFSDHKYISFEITFNPRGSSKVLRNPRNTNWDQYRNILRRELGRPPKITETSDMERATVTLTRKLNQAYVASCPVTRIKRKHTPPWWNRELRALRRVVHDLFKLAKAADCTECWEEYKCCLQV